MSRFNIPACVLILSMLPVLAIAAEVTPEPSVEENIRNMDKDHDGMVTVHEVRAMIEAKHGKGYEEDALDRLESTAKGASCTTSFAKPMY